MQILKNRETNRRFNSWCQLSISGSTPSLADYVNRSQYARVVTSYLVLGNHLTPETSIRLAKLNQRVEAVRGHANRSMLYRTLKDLENLGVVVISKSTVRGIKIGKLSNGRSAWTMIYLKADNKFIEFLTNWAVSLGYESFSEFLHNHDYPNIDIQRCCRIMTDGYTYIQENQQIKSLSDFVRK